MREQTDMRKTLKQRIKVAEDIVKIAAQDLQDAAGLLEDLEHKKSHYQYHRRRKEHQKKMAKDPAYRLLCRLEKRLFGPCIGHAPYESGSVFKGLLNQIETTDDH